MRKNSSHFSVFCALLAVLSVTLAACGGSGSSATPSAAPTATAAATLPPSAYTTASCSTSGATSGTITGGNLAGVGTVTSPAVGGCSFSDNLATALAGAKGGTYAGTISLTAPAGLPNITNPPPGFSTSNFVPLFYVTLQLTNVTGTIAPNTPNITAAVNSITLASNSSNFFIGTWSAIADGSTPPGAAASTFTGWSYNNSQTAPVDVPLTVTPPNTLSLAAYACTPAVNCNPTTYTGVSFTLVQVVGYFN
jgi:hypothetical protein